jgi:chloramphenicol-sensitive protein RarD
MTSPHSRENGLAYALAAYVIWGLLPLYLHQVHNVPPLEFVGWRTVFSMPICLAIVIATRQGRAIRNALSNPRLAGLLGLSALLIGGNWTIYVIIINQGHIYAASLGYYINPLLNVVLGTLFLNEKLTRAKWIAVALAGVGVAILCSGAWQTLGYSLTLAFSFAAYGFLRKKIPVAALPGLTIETCLLTLPAIALIALGHGPNGIAITQGWTQGLLVAASGLATAVPLLLFTIAAQRMDYSTIGFLQFIAPTLVFFQGLWLFHEKLERAQLGCFILIWAALGVFCWDLWQTSKSARA